MSRGGGRQNNVLGQGKNDINFFVFFKQRQI